MTDEEFEEEFRRRLYKRALEEQNSNLWNFKRYYSAASFYKWVDIGTSAVTAVLGAVLTYGLAWQELPLSLMVSFSLVVGTLSLYKAIERPGKKSERIHAVGRRYQRLHDDLQNYIDLDLKDESRGHDELRDRFQELADKRHQLKEETYLTGIWYRWIKWRRSEDIYEEATTSEEERAMLDPDGYNN